MKRRRIVLGWVFLVIFSLFATLSMPLGRALALVPADLSSIKFSYDSSKQQYIPQGGASSQLSSSFSYLEAGGYNETFYVGNKKVGQCAQDFIKVDANASPPTVSYYRITNSTEGKDSKGQTQQDFESTLGLTDMSAFDSKVVPLPNCHIGNTYHYGPNGDLGAATGGTTTATNPTGDKSKDDDPELNSCENNSGGLLGPALCAVVQGVDAGANFLYKYAISHLQFSLYAPSKTTNSDGETIGGLNQSAYTAVKGSWNVVARMASALMVIGFLIMIIAQAASNSNLLEPYTVKRLLWRIVVAFILINLSWYLFSVVLEIANIVGGGIRDIILAPVSGNGAAIVTPNLTGNTTLDTVLLGALAPAAGATLLALFVSKNGGVGGFTSWLFYLLAPVVLGMFITLMIGMGIIILRQGILVVLAITAPLAVFLWVFEGTRQYYDKWKDTFVALLLFYPAFQALVATGALLAWATSATSTNGGTSFFTFIIALVCYLGPFFMIIKVLEWTGGALHAASNLVRGSGIHQGARGKFGEWAKHRAETTSTGLSRATVKNAKQQMHTEHGLHALENQQASGLGGLLTRNNTLQQRAAQMRRPYTLEADQKRIAKLDASHVQELLHYGGDTVAAEKALKAQGFETGHLQQTAAAMKAQGMDMEHPSASLMEAAGSMGAQTGMLTDAFSTPANQGGWFANNYGHGNPTAEAEAGSMVIQWGLGAKSQGQFSHGTNVEKIENLNQVAGSNMAPTLHKMGQQFAQGGMRDAQVTLGNGQTATVARFDDAKAQQSLDRMVEAAASGQLTGQRAAAFREYFDGKVDPNNPQRRTGGIYDSLSATDAARLRRTVETLATAAQTSTTTRTPPRSGGVI